MRFNPGDACSTFDALLKRFLAIEGYMLLEMRQEAFQEYLTIARDDWHDPRIGDLILTIEPFLEWMSSTCLKVQQGVPKADVMVELGYPAEYFK